MSCPSLTSSYPHAHDSLIRVVTILSIKIESKMFLIIRITVPQSS